MRVAIVHYWLVGMRGGEKVLENICRIFPDADIFTHVYAPETISDALNRHTIRTTFISKLPFARRFYQNYLPLMPAALEELDLSQYDLIISSEAGPAKGIIPRPDATHICYCHSPMRYIWDQYHLYRADAGVVRRLALPMMAHRLRQWDVSSAARVDHFVANSRHVASRINKYWRRESRVLAPPVDVGAFKSAPRQKDDDFYLWAGELVSYKRPDQLIEAFNRLGHRLIVIGGPDGAREKLKAKARDNITFLGHASFEMLRYYMARCKALIFPGEEDFGIVPVEVMASGRPVIAYGRGGALDTVIDGRTGILYRDQSVEALIVAIERFEASGLVSVDPEILMRHAHTFDAAHFRDGFRRTLLGAGVDRSDMAMESGFEDVPMHSALFKPS